MPDYFSDRENGPRARTEQVISPTVWAGVVAYLGSIDNAVENVAPSRITLSPAPVEDPRF